MENWTEIIRNGRGRTLPKNLCLITIFGKEKDTTENNDTSTGPIRTNTNNERSEPCTDHRQYKKDTTPTTLEQSTESTSNISQPSNIPTLNPTSTNPTTPATKSTAPTITIGPETRDGKTQVQTESGDSLRLE